jgi:hypothetical protein
MKKTAKVLGIAVLTIAQSFAGPKGTTQKAGDCSINSNGNNNQLTIDCRGIGKEQGQKMLAILNKILANRLDTDAVMAKLDEILKAVNPNIPTKSYLCDGEWRSMGPGANAALLVQLGGDDSAFQEMIRLNNSRQYGELLTKCLANIKSSPEWLTPRLLCGLAYISTGDKAKAKEMLAEFDSKTGPAYEADACHQMSDYLRKALQ